MSARVSLVTGAARGIGRSLALALAAQGDKLVLAARSTREQPSRAMPGTLEDVADEVRALGAEVDTMRVDLAVPEDVDRLAAYVLERHGGCDLLVNNAAVSFVGKFLDVPVRRWGPVLAVDLLAPVALTHALLPGMLERGRGVILNVSSGAAVTDDVPQAPYGSAKAALERLTTGLEQQYGRQGVAFHCVRIDELVLTEAVELAAPELPADTVRCTPEQLAAALVWLVEQPQLSGRIVTHAELRRAGALVGQA